MVRARPVDRRQFLSHAGSALALPAASALLPTGLAAQTATGGAATGAGTFDSWRQLGDLTRRAVDMGISVPRMSAHIDTAGGRDFQQIMPAAVELLRSLERPTQIKPVAPGELARLVDEADDLLRKVHQAERNLPDERGEGLSITATPGRPSYDSIKASYRQLFETAKVREANRSSLEWYMSQLINAENQKRWYSVAQAACCPWYFVGIIHAMEASFNFRSHLHNGDSLKARTFQVPAGRPKTWNPPNDWETSAVDALLFDGFVDVSDWSLERTLYRWEAYNGFRSRGNGINTPYLWSFSNHYAKGKFVADNVWDPNAVSKQCGAAVMLRVLLDRQLIQIPA
ncbi:MAG: hypothetical protein NW217_00505 [Hyphomicrobiaceae bacterium]|nr:hypothetical protein [Hyphomicrobiaceae bacterium]